MAKAGQKNHGDGKLRVDGTQAAQVYSSVCHHGQESLIKGTHSGGEPPREAGLIRESEQVTCDMLKCTWQVCGPDPPYV